MKNIKRITAILLALCLVLGLPFAVSAVGTTDPSDFKLLYAMEMPDWMAKNDADKGRTLLLYFNSTPKDPGQVYFELLGYDGATLGISLAMSFNQAYGKWGQSNPIAITMDANLNGNYSEEKTLAERFSRVATRTWFVCISQPDKIEGAVSANSQIDGWKNTLGQTMATAGQRRNAYIKGNGDAADYNAGNGDALSVPVVRKADLLTLDEVILTDTNQVSLTFSETVYWDQRYSKQATLRIVDDEYNVVKYDSANAETPYSTTAGTDLEIILSVSGSPAKTLTAQMNATAIGGLSIQQHLANANAQAGGTTYRLCAAISEGGMKPTRGEYAGNGFTDIVWSYDSTHTYKPLVAQNTDGTRDRSWCEVTAIEANASVGGRPYATLGEAISAATSGQTVTLMKDMTVESVNVPTGITLDLAGRTLTATHVIATGYVTDSTDGAGCLIMPMNDGSNDHLLVVPENNVTLPLYDAQRGGYRFFACELRHEQRAMEHSVMFGTMINASDAALTLLSDPVNAGVSLTMNLPLTVDGEAKEPLSYSFKAATLTDYAEKSLENPTKTYAIVLTVTGFDTLNRSVVLGATPKLGTGTDAFVLGEEQVFSYLTQGE